MTRSASEVLDAYTATVSRLRQPSQEMADFVAFFMNEHMSAAGPHKDTAFYPILRRPGPFTVDDGAAFARLLGSGLAGAPVYQVTEAMCEIVAAAAGQNLQGRLILRRTDLPAASGFAWLEQPLELTAEEDGSPLAVQVLSWSAQEVAMREGTQAAVRFAVWAPTPAAGGLGTGPPGSTRTAPGLRSVLGPVNLVHSDIWLLDVAMAQPAGELPAPRSATILLTYLAALGKMLQTEIAAIDRPQIHRAARRRAEREVGRSDVQVVILRRPAGRPGPAGGRATPGDTQSLNWPYRLGIGEHYRHRTAPVEHPHRPVPSQDGESCAACGRAVSRISWYAKGPAGAPLRQPRRVNRLAR